MKRYLILSEDGALDVPPVYVMAGTAHEAIRRYCREVQSKEPFMRDYVEGNSMDDFVAKLLFSPEERANALIENGLASPPLEIVRQKIFEYFAERPDLGKLYAQYIESRDEKNLTDDVYEFISESDISGYDAIEDSTIRTLD